MHTERSRFKKQWGVYLSYLYLPGQLSLLDSLALARTQKLSAEFLSSGARLGRLFLTMLRNHKKNLNNVKLPLHV